MIKNGKDTPLNKTSQELPDLSGALCNWFQKMSFVIITKTIINHRVVETKKVVNFQGVIQPFSDQSISMLSEGQRAWRWYTLHTEVSLEMSIDDVITYDGLNYRIKSKGNYSKYGYLKYELIEDYQL